ncbi:MAG: hypothetical protein ACR2JB_14760 [Bryobacteraceae bacterium]
MLAPLLPSPLDQMGRQHFSFCPAIKNADPNEWMLALSSWSEIKVVNPRTGREIWIPRQYIDGVSYASHPMLVIRLTKELEYRAGALWPRVQRVIEMPNTADSGSMINAVKNRVPGPAPVLGIRLENRTDSPSGKALSYVGIGAILVSILAALFSTLARP